MPTPLSDVEAEALGRRWLAAGGGWRDGMLCRCERPNDYGRVLDAPQWPTDRPTWWPDLRDAATRGAALEAVRERWGGDVWVQGNRYHQWREVGWVQSELCWYVAGLHRSDVDRVNGWRGFSTEAEALVSAMESRHAL